jgi:hypothetical protein
MQQCPQILITIDNVHTKVLRGFLEWKDKFAFDDLE